MFTSPRILAGLAIGLAAACAQADPGPLKTYAPPLDPAFAELLHKADLSAGERYFERKCSQCHDGFKDGGDFKGPHLWNVMGRKAAAREGFRYSPAMREVTQAWTYATLDYYLKDTETAVPGREMNFVGIEDDATRANVIAYIRTLADSPAPLP